MENKYTLLYGQRFWGKGDYDLDPDTFIKFFLKYISSENQVDFGSENQTEVCKNIVRTSIPELQSALNLDDDNFRIRFRDYMRGFDDKTYERIKSQRTSMINGILSTIQNLIDKIKNKIRSLDESTDEIKIKILKIELDKLLDKKKKYKSDLDESSMLKHVAKKDSISSKIEGSLNFDNIFYENDVWLLESVFNVDFDFPLRFLNWISFSGYEKALNIWKNSQNLSKTLFSIEEEFNPVSIFKRYLKSELPFIKSREEILNEIDIALRHDLYTAASLLIMTQIEGILTEFVIEIDNKKNLGVFVPGSCRKFFDNSENEQEARSIVHLLLGSKYSNMIDLTLLDYIAKDYYPDRSALVHGEYTFTPPVGKVKLNLSLLVTILYYYENYINEGKLNFF